MAAPENGFDAQAMTGSRQTGLGVYAMALSKVLGKHPEAVDLKLLSPKEHREFKGTLERLKWERYDLPMAAMREEVELLHSPAFSVPPDLWPPGIFPKFRKS